jgi:uncharacterized membrane protein YeaQ/YmgE (transglycosylase-associated protein family)
MLWSILGWIIFGLIIGAVARAIMPGRQEMTLTMTMLLGVAGSFVGGFIASLLVPGRPLVSPAGWIMSLVGAVLLLFVVGKMQEKK